MKTKMGQLEFNKGIAGLEDKLSDIVIPRNKVKSEILLHSVYFEDGIEFCNKIVLVFEKLPLKEVIDRFSFANLIEETRNPSVFLINKRMKISHPQTNVHFELENKLDQNIKLRFNVNY